MVVCGRYGTFSDVVNAVSLESTLSYILLGSRHDAFYGMSTSILSGNRSRTYRQSKNIEILTQKELSLQIDGNLAASSTKFRFSVLEGTLKMKY